jgi:2-polyprenyl-3-methyl-5-hydroxy-6-metoxy-1,4-benzoquinol methylase
MSDCLRAPFADSLIIASDINQTSVSVDHAKLSRPVQSDIARTYNTGQTYDAWHRETNTKNWDSLWTRRLQFVSRFKSGGRHLDIGAGDGTFLRKTKEAGFSVIGTELSELCATFIRQTGFDVKLGQFTEIKLPEEKYDLITLWHILEHVPNPGAVMSRINKIIAPDGILVIAVPNEDHPIWR